MNVKSAAVEQQEELGDLTLSKIRQSVQEENNEEVKKHKLEL